MPSIFYAFTEEGGREVYITNGLPGGTRLLKDINPGAADAIGIFGADFGVLGDHLFFGASDDSGGHLWMSDGTTAGTHSVGTTAQASGSTELVRLGDQLFWMGKLDISHVGLFGVNETGSVQQIAVPNQLSGASFDDAVVLGGQILFQGLGDTGWELWATDGTEGGTHLVKDIFPGSGSNPAKFTLVNGFAVFTAGSSNGIELWSTDGTKSGTMMLKDINPNGSADIDDVISAGNLAYFAANDRVNGAELWVTDGTRAGTHLVKNINPGADGAMNAGLDGIAVGNKFVFRAYDPAHGLELWVSNGTAGGTKLLKDLKLGVDGSNISEFALLNGKAYFQVSTPLGVDLWVTNGTAAGTHLVKSIQEGGGFDPRPMSVVDGQLIFAVKGFQTGVEVWVSDGTAGGTRMLQDINLGPGDSYPLGFTELPRLPGFDPTNITLTKSHVGEFSAEGALVGALRAADPDGNDGFTYYLLDDAGGRFRIDGGRLEVADGLLLDFEQKASWQVKVQVTDGLLHTYVKTLTIRLDDLTPEVITGDDRANHFVGGAGKDSFSGGLGADTLDGGGGIDTLTGGDGSDTYVVNVAGDRVVESNASSATGGFDEVQSSVAWTLGANLENLTLTGSAAVNGTGNALGNTLLGNTGANLLKGLGGADGMSGGLGNDTLTGGDGVDIFGFFDAPDSAANRDVITDFDAAAEKIYLQLSVYTAAGAGPGALAAAAFWASATGQAHDASDRIIYNTATGVLTYDADGAGGAAGVQFAVLQGAPTGVDAADFFLF